MQSLRSGNELALAVMEVALHISRLVRAETWKSRPARLGVPQFRTLIFLNAYPASAPSVVADYLMLSRPAVSRLVDELVERRLVKRRPSDDDRRRLELSLTAGGAKQLEAHYAAACDAIAERMASLPASALADVSRAMTILAPCFAAVPAKL